VTTAPRRQQLFGVRLKQRIASTWCDVQSNSTCSCMRTRLSCINADDIRQQFKLPSCGSTKLPATLAPGAKLEW
jgi:hypothetical protein